MDWATNWATNWSWNANWAATLLLVLAPLAAAAGGFWLGRRTGAHAARLRELDAQLEGAHKERELLAAELAASRDELRRIREELGGYRAQVTEHFVGASERMRELTLQYRAVYEHLSEGARALCPEGFEKLEGGLGLDALPREAGGPEPLAVASDGSAQLEPAATASGAAQALR